MWPVKLLFVEQCGQKHLDLAIWQGDANQAVSDGWVRGRGNVQFCQGLFGFDLERFGDDLLVFATCNEGFDGVAAPCRQSNNTI